MRSIRVKPVEMAFLYGILAALGVVAIILGIPSFSLTFSGALTPFWGVSMTVSAGLGCIALLSNWVRVERWALFAIVLLDALYLGAALYLISGGGTEASSRGAFAVVLMASMWFPVVQWLRLRKGTVPEGMLDS